MVRQVIGKEANAMLKTLPLFLKDDFGATAVEYGLIAALVSVAAIVGMQALGGGLQAMFTNIAGLVNP
jgi:pilus assembly protein Flp/PilA